MKRACRRTLGCAAALLVWLPAVALDDDIRDIRGPKIAAAAWLLPAIAAAAVLLGCIVLGIWRWRRRQRQRELLPFELALRRLDDIRSLMTPSTAREFCIAASDIVRGYIEQQFGVVVIQRTTEEFLQDLPASGNAALARHRPLLEEFLERCDIVKFAGIGLTVSHMESLRLSARAFVNETAKPVDVRDALPAT